MSQEIILWTCNECEINTDPLRGDNYTLNRSEIPRMIPLGEKSCEKGPRTRRKRLGGARNESFFAANYKVSERRFARDSKREESRGRRERPVAELGLQTWRNYKQWRGPATIRTEVEVIRFASIIVVPDRGNARSGGLVGRSYEPACFRKLLPLMGY